LKVILSCFQPLNKKIWEIVKPLAISLFVELTINS